MKKLNRRRFLKGLGGITLGLPFLGRFANEARASAGGNVPRRLIVVAYPMGTVNTRFQPMGQGASFTLPYISAPLEPFMDRCLFVTNCDNEVMSLNSQHNFGHPAKKEGVLTGTLLTQAFSGDGSNRIENVIPDQDGSDQGGANNESVDHFIGQRILGDNHIRPSIDLGVNGRPERERNDRPSSFFFEAPANPVTVQHNPARAFFDVFGNLNLDAEAEQALLDLKRRNKSVLDAVRTSFTDLRQGLSPADRAVLDDHADKIRDIELTIEEITCNEPLGIPNDGTATSPYSPFEEMSMMDLSALQIEIMARSMACDLAPVGRLEFIEQQMPFFGVETVDQAQNAWNTAEAGKGWHAMVHGDASPVDGVPTRANSEYPDHYSDFLLDGYRFFVQQFADLLTALDSIPEGMDGQSVLDNSLVVLVSDYGDGRGHNSNKMNFVLAGNTGPARNGYHFDCGPGYGFYDRSDYNTNHMLTSIIQMFCLKNQDGSDVNEFGLQGFTEGPINPLFT